MKDYLTLKRNAQPKTLTTKGAEKNYFYKIITPIFFMFAIMLLSSCTFATTQSANIPKSIVMYDFSEAPLEFKDLNVPDFLAFATANKEITSQNFIYSGFYPGEISIGFSYEGKYAQYAKQEAEYLKLLESEGFHQRAAWEGFTHYQKQWSNFYVLVTTGISYFGNDEERFIVDVVLTKEPINFPF